jgi:hypothetical protein
VFPFSASAAHIFRTRRESIHDGNFLSTAFGIISSSQIFHSMAQNNNEQNPQNVYVLPNNFQGVFFTTCLSTTIRKLAHNFVIFFLLLSWLTKRVISRIKIPTAKRTFELVDAFKWLSDTLLGAWRGIVWQ